jgi:alpha-galactosidase
MGDVMGGPVGPAPEAERPPGARMGRRRFLGGLAGAAGGLLLGRRPAGPGGPERPAPAPEEETTSDGLALTPPMGWNPWNRFETDISEELIRQNAQAMAQNGMKKAGYEYIIVDDGWAAGRDKNGVLAADPERFPSGMRALTSYVHGLGLKMGIYTNAGASTCTSGPGSLAVEAIDAATFAAWGVDYIKIDWCHTDYLDTEALYIRYREAVAKTGRPIVLSLGNWGYKGQWDWCLRARHLVRTTPDIEDSWETMTIMADINARYAAYARPGRWNDPDMLEVGNGGMTEAEYRTQVSLWAMMAAPLIAGNDLRHMPASILDLLVNPNVVAIDQDPAGIQGTWIADDGQGLQVWRKPLREENTCAFALVNRRSKPSLIEFNWKDAGLKYGFARVHDLWSDTNMGYYRSSYAAEVPAHGTVVVKVKG